MTLSLNIDSINLFALIFCRVGGMIFFNPLLGRKNIPAQFRVALVLGISIIIAPTIALGTIEGLSGFSLFLAMVKELFIGFCIGMLFQLYYYMIFVAGDIIDTGFGLSMAKVFDPATNIQVSMSGNIFQLIFVMYFFVTDCHLIFIRLIVSTFDLVGLGAFSLGADIGSFLMTQFVYSFGLIMHLAVPFMASSFILEISMGVLMKLIPQINVFSIHFQFKIILGLSLLFLFAIPVTNLLQKYLNELFVNMQGLIGLFA
jgi:flagellar biosynthetic protein FliR